MTLRVKPICTLALLQFTKDTMASQHPDTTASAAAASASKQAAIDELAKQGVQVRREVMGDAFVDRAVANTNEFTAPIQEFVNANAWGTVWTRPGLSRRDRSLLNLGMLSCLNRGTELAGHVRGALNNGLTQDEIREVILQVAVYAGAPAGLEAARIADKVIQEWKESKT
jgi:4-carboxymuconolactone decarboxylase